MPLLQPKKESLELFDKPCSHGCLNAICDEDKLNKVKDAILKQPFYHKSNE